MSDTKYLTCAETAKIVRTALKEAFPKIKFSVRSHVYAGGATIDISYTDGPQQKVVERVAKAFEGATFDGMTDYKGGKVHEFKGQPVHFGSDYVFVKQEFSPERLKVVEDALTALSDIERNNLDFKLRVGRAAHGNHGGRDPFLSENSDRRWYIQQVAAGLSPEPEVQSATAEAAVVTRTY